MLNKYIYNKLPSENRLVNNGVAEVSEDHSEAAQSVLRYELETFVCDGQYKKGIEVVLDTFLINLESGNEQPGIWISGFYGSGKSHLAKMLRTLWTDYKFMDGASARSIAKLPDSVAAHLKELSIQGKRHGGLHHAAAGKLGAGAGDKVRLALLGIIFKSKGLPEQLNQAQLVLWLKREGLFEPIEVQLQAVGRSLAQELPHMYVSNHLAKALLAVRPGLADSESEARQLLKAQFPQVQDVSNEQMVNTITEALSDGSHFPLTLVVLDEVQQYIGNDVDKAYMVQEVTESLCKHFTGKLLFIGTGQSALSGMPNLMRLMGRFPVPIMLSDVDVENVTRQIILAKKPSTRPLVEQSWRSNLGEISRHLRGTKLEHVTEDEQLMTDDYPILPVRRRFWERVLRTIDTTGTVSQLRSQLRVVHEAVLATSDLPLGHVVAGDFLYDQIAANLMSTAQLPKEVYENVQRFAAGDASAQLKGKLLKLIYLINKLPADAALNIGLKATDDVLADLLVTDLASGSSDLRKQLPDLLHKLQNDDRLIMSLGPNGLEYRLQTVESSAWYEEFRAQEAGLKASPQRIEQQRADLFKARFADVLKKVRVVQGKDNVERRLTPTYDETLPKDNDKALYLWIQDGWQTEEKSVIAEAKSKSSDNPTLFAFLRSQNKTELTNAIVSLESARSTLRKKGTPATEQGRDAQRSMESRERNADKELKDLLDALFAGARVFQAGGQEVTGGNELSDRINSAAKPSAIRLYKDFDVADSDQWSKVLDEARKGNLEALKAVGHTQEADKQPVCQKLLAFIGPGKKGSEIRDNFESPPFGWPRDAIDGALFALLSAGHIRAMDASSKLVDAKSLDRNKLTQASFRQESITISPPQLIKIRQLFSAVGVPCQPKEELAKVPMLIAKLRDLASKAGGMAPAPLTPKLTAIEALEAQSGNGQLLELYIRNDELAGLAKQWATTADAIQKRLPVWNQLTSLLEHAKELGPYEEIKAEKDAIQTQRSLLSKPNAVRPLLDRTADLLRQALNAKQQGFTDAFLTQQAHLAADADWRKLSDDQRTKLTQNHHLAPLKPVDLATPGQLQDALDECNLDYWISKTQALSSRFDAARHSAVMLLKPNVVHVTIPKRTLNNETELKAWLAEVELLLADKLKSGPVAL